MSLDDNRKIVDAKLYSRLINNIMRWKFRIVIMAS